jgi:hypothetical protein
LEGVGHVAVLELSLEEVESGAMGHMKELEPNSVGKRGPKLRDTWQRRSSPKQGGETRAPGARGSVGAYLGRKVRSGAIGYVAIRGCMPCSLS